MIITTLNLHMAAVSCLYQNEGREGEDDGGSWDGIMYRPPMCYSTQSISDLSCFSMVGTVVEVATTVS